MKTMKMSLLTLSALAFFGNLHAMKKPNMLPPLTRADTREVTLRLPPLFEAVGDRNIKEIEMLLSQGADPLLRHNNYINALEFAVVNDRNDELKLLLTKVTPQQLNKKDRDHQGPLLDAMTQNNVPALVILLGAGAYDPKMLVYAERLKKQSPNVYRFFESFTAARNIADPDKAIEKVTEDVYPISLWVTDSLRKALELDKKRANL